MAAMGGGFGGHGFAMGHFAGRGFAINHGRFAGRGFAMEVNTGKMGTKERCVASQASAVLYCFA
jgi:hypothetical protein